MLTARMNIGIKRMGEIDQKAFQDACKERFHIEEANLQASMLCSLWQENLKDPGWHPFKIVHINGDTQVYYFKYFLNLIIVVFRYVFILCACANLLVFYYLYLHMLL